ncbi:MAG: hypothetical protein H6709_13355 [Kofleriaceae bacterium]|nr:hypothetical protein [Kofleriaceae bacterium]
MPRLPARRHRRRRAAIAGAAAGVALAAGLYLYLRGREQGAYARQFTIAPRAGGAEATWSWPF